jgi:adenosine deaminase
MRANDTHASAAVSLVSPLVSLADLHRHLDGSLRRDTLDELAARARAIVPANILFHAGMGLDDALSRFAFTLSLLQRPEEVCRVAREIADDALEEGVTTLEIRFAPQLHCGAPPEAIVDAALEGLASATRPAGLVLCGLYGEPTSILESLVEIARARVGVVGIDLAGGPSPGHAIRLEDYERAYRRAEELGIGRTVHAAEGRSPHEIRIAIERLRAQRIGHGTTLLDDPSVVDLVLERDVVIEACPTSNVHTGVIASTSEHPLPRWLERGVKTCVCTDNTLLSAVTAPEEHTRARAIPGMTDALLARAIATGHSAAFARR